MHNIITMSQSSATIVMMTPIVCNRTKVFLNLLVRCLCIFSLVNEHTVKGMWYHLQSVFITTLASFPRHGNISIRKTNAYLYVSRYQAT